jgi:K+-sensing histidine kinase KdpD
MYYSVRQESRGAETKIAQVSGLLEAGQGVNELAVEVDRYRESSTAMKDKAVSEGQAAIARTHERFEAILARINRDVMEDAERKQLDSVDAKLDKLIELSQRVAKYYNSPDAFRLAETRDAHADVRRDITQLNASLQKRGRAGVGSIEGVATTNVRTFLAGGGAILLLLLAVYFREYWAYQRPLKQLHALALQVEGGKAAPTGADNLPGLFGRVAASLNSMAGVLERQAKERHKFMLDLFSDFSVPLSLLRAGKILVGPKAATTEIQQLQASETVKRGLAALAGSLEDLGDLAEFGNLKARLEEKLVDLSEIVVNVSRSLTGPDSSKWITTALPAMPVWTKIDSRRMERVLTHVILKVAGTLAENEKIHVTVTDRSEQGDSGVEILVQGTLRMQQRSSVGSGPEIDITKHWINEKGLFLGLMNKIIRVHGGEITASGVVGTSAQVRIHLPQERVVVHGLINAPLGLSVNLASGSNAGSTDADQQKDA